MYNRMWDIIKAPQAKCALFHSHELTLTDSGTRNSFLDRRTRAFSYKSREYMCSFSTSQFKLIGGPDDTQGWSPKILSCSLMSTNAKNTPFTLLVSSSALSFSSWCSTFLLFFAKQLLSGTILCFELIRGLREGLWDALIPLGIFWLVARARPICKGLEPIIHY